MLKNLISDMQQILLTVRISLVVAGRFWRWRLELWRHPERLLEGTTTRMKRTLLFIRHGQTTWNVEHLLPGQLSGIALTEAGHEQAARLGEALQVLPITAIISSSLERARETAAYLARARDLPVLLDDDLMDTNVGPWAGKKMDDLAQQDPAWKEFVRDPTRAPEGIETFPQVQQRAVAAVERWLAREETGNCVAFVAHADVVKLLLAHYIGLESRRAGSLLIENASVSMVELEDEHAPRVFAIGWSPRPGWLKPPVPEVAAVDSITDKEASVPEKSDQKPEV
jgi:probable phosphoglycerate mutase